MNEVNSQALRLSAIWQNVIRVMVTVVLLASLFSLSAPHAAATGQEDRPGCSISGWGESKMGASIPVYRTPSVKSKIVGYFPTDDDYRTLKAGDAQLTRQLAEFEILDHHRGWFRVADAAIVTLRDASWEKAPSSLSGWIRGEHIRFWVEDDHAYLAPNRKAPAAITFQQDIHDGWDTLLDCRGAWAKLSLSKSMAAALMSSADATPVVRSVWVTSICGQAMTGCDFRATKADVGDGRALVAP